MLLYGLHQSIQGLALSGGQISNLIVARNGAFEHVGGQKGASEPNQARTDSIQRRGISFIWSRQMLKSRQSVCSNHTIMNFLDTIIVPEGRLNLSLSEWRTANQAGDPRHAPECLY
jgi:hypothetical protein